MKSPLIVSPLEFGGLPFAEAKAYLDQLYERFNTLDFIADDPISIPHLFHRQADIEIAGFFAATIAWGNRKSIVKNGHHLMRLMGHEPHRFVLEASQEELAQLNHFVHRTFNGADAAAFVLALRRLCNDCGGVGAFFQATYAQREDMREVLSAFREAFFALPHEKRVEKHLSSIGKGAACKRLNMYVKWMVRNDASGVDFGLWKTIPSRAIYLPLDVHTANIGRHFGLLTRKQNDWLAVEEITRNLARFDAEDPVKYDFALFGAGINKVIV